jgi:hypothetical protein
LEDYRVAAEDDLVVHGLPAPHGAAVLRVSPSDAADLDRLEVGIALQGLGPGVGWSAVGVRLGDLAVSQITPETWFIVPVPGR